MPLTELECRHAKPLSKPYKIVDAEGLYLDVRTTGKKVWRQRYMMNGREKILTHGRYPQVSLVKAREKRNEAKESLSKGQDPTHIKLEEKHLAQYKAGQTNEVVALEWLEAYRTTWSEKHYETIKSRLECNVFPMLGSFPMSDTTPPMIFACVQTVERRRGSEVALRVLNYVSQYYRYGVRTGRALADPTRDLRGGLKPAQRSHFASIKVEELPDLLEKMRSNSARLLRPTMIAMWLMLLTFVRTKELLHAQWPEFDLEKGEWHIPAERMKMRKPHFVPLPKQAVALLRELETLTMRRETEVTSQPQYLFPSVTRRGQPLSNTSLLMALRRMGYYKRMTGHGFRALAMSAIKEQLGYRHEVVDRQLAHEPRNSIDKAYDRADFKAERKVMMQDWANYIDRCKASSA